MYRTAVMIGPRVAEECVILYETPTEYHLVYDMAEGPHINPQTLKFKRTQKEQAEKAWIDRVAEHLLK